MSIIRSVPAHTTIWNGSWGAANNENESSTITHADLLNWPLTLKHYLKLRNKRNVYFICATNLHLLSEGPAGNQLEWIHRPKWMREYTFTQTHIKTFGNSVMGGGGHTDPLNLETLHGLGCFFISSLRRANSSALRCWCTQRQTEFKKKVVTNWTLVCM